MLKYEWRVVRPNNYVFLRVLSGGYLHMRKCKWKSFFNSLFVSARSSPESALLVLHSLLLFSLDSFEWC